MTNGRRFALLLLVAAALAAGALLLRAGRTSRASRPAIREEPAGEGAEESARSGRLPLPRAPSATFEVVVRSRTTQEPIPGAVVERSTFEGQRRETAPPLETDASGRVALPPVPGRAELLVLARGFVGAAVECAAGEERALVGLEPLGAAEVLLRGSGGEPARGRVQLVPPPPAGAARLLLHPAEAWPDDALAGETGPDGVARFPLLPPAAGWEVRAVAPGCAIAERRFALEPGGVARVEVALLGAVTIRGRALSASGAPLEGAEMRLFQKIGADWEQRALADAGPDGGFAFTAALEGSGVVQGEWRRPEGLVLVATPVAIRAGGSIDLGDLRPGAGVVELTVRGAPEPPDASPGVRVVLFLAADPAFGAVPFASTAIRASIGSTLRYEGIPAGRVQATVVPDESRWSVAKERRRFDGGFLAMEVALAPPVDSPTLEVELPSGGGVRTAILLGEEGVRGNHRDVPRARTPLLFSGLREEEAGEIWVFEEGRFASAPFRLGGARGRVTIDAGRFVAGASVGGRVRGARPRAEVLACRPDAPDPLGGAFLRGALDRGGRYRLSGLPPETLVELRVRSGDRFGPGRVVRTPSSGEVDETVDLEGP